MPRTSSAELQLKRKSCSTCSVGRQRRRACGGTRRAVSIVSSRRQGRGSTRGDAAGDPRAGPASVSRICAPCLYVPPSARRATRGAGGIAVSSEVPHRVCRWARIDVGARTLPVPRACRGCRVQFCMSAAGHLRFQRGAARRARRQAPPRSRETGRAPLSTGERGVRQCLAGLWCGMVAIPPLTARDLPVLRPVRRLRFVPAPYLCAAEMPPKGGKGAAQKGALVVLGAQVCIILCTVCHRARLCAPPYIAPCYSSNCNSGIAQQRGAPAAIYCAKNVLFPTSVGSPCDVGN